jgi:nitrogen-specific signal transduction histidine kinase/CheY-like chemotaxis protein
MDLGGERLIQCAAVDITERRLAEEERRQAEARAQRNQKMASLGSLAGGMAHDMNNVLGAILALAAVHQHLAPEGSSLRAHMDTIASACQRGKSLVQGLLGFAREELAEVRRLDLNALIQDQAALLEHTTLRKVVLRTELGPDLRPLLGDAAALSHAVMNLCVNAVDAMDEGGTLTLRTRNLDGDQILLEVADTGQGMSPEVAERALDPFFTTKPAGKGTGLGLPIVYRTVQAHQGSLEIHSRPGLGTTVAIRLPACAAADVPAAAEAAAPAGPRPLRVLLVDDDPLLLASLPALLETAGHHATAAGGGEEAVRILERDPRFDVVLLDLNMPGLGGAGTLPRLRALAPGLPVLLITGKADQQAMDLARAQPRVDLLSKPFGLAELQARLRQLLFQDPAP